MYHNNLHLMFNMVLFATVAVMMIIQWQGERKKGDKQSPIWRLVFAIGCIFWSGGNALILFKHITVGEIAKDIGAFAFIGACLPMFAGWTRRTRISP